MKPGNTSRPSCWATSRRTGSNAGAAQLVELRAHVARGLQDLHHVRRRSARSRPRRGRRRSRAGARTTPRPTPARRPAPSATEIAARRRVLQHRARATRAAPPSARAARRCRAWSPGTGAAGEGIVSASSRRVPTRMCSACASGLSSARRPTVSPSSTSDGYARTVWPVPGSATAFGIVPNVQLVWPVRSSLLRRGGERARAASAAPARAARRDPGRAAIDLALLVLDAERHLQIGRAAGRGPRRRAGSARRAGPRSRPRAPPAAAPLPRLQALEHLRRHVRHRHEPLAQVLRQRADQRDRRARRAAPGTSHSKPCRAQLRQRLERHVDGHAVVRGCRARSGSVSLQLQLALAPDVRPPGDVLGRRRVDQQLARERQQVRPHAALVAPPAVEVRAGDDALRHARGVEVVQRLVVDEDVAPARALLERLDLLDQRRVRRRRSGGACPTRPRPARGG